MRMDLDLSRGSMNKHIKIQDRDMQICSYVERLKPFRLPAKEYGRLYVRSGREKSQE